MNLEEFMNKCREQEYGFYREMIDKLKEAWDKADKEKFKEYPRSFWEVADNICADYDVHDLFRQEVFGEKHYINLDRMIDEHITKLQKSITKVTGEVIDIEKTADLTYNVKGNKASCTILVTPAKLTSTKNVMKIRFKIVDIIEHPAEELEEKTFFEESEYVKQWKQQELEGYLKALERWKQNVALLKEEEEKALVDFNKAKQDYYDKNGKYPEVEKGRFTDPEIQQAYQRRKAAEDKSFQYRYNENRFFAEYGYSDEFEERCMKEIDRHFNELQAKVEKKIGRIIKIESFGGDDYAFEGENGNCIVEVVWAGGYNIQRLHTRWIVKNWD